MNIMFGAPAEKPNALFQVYLRLRPPAPGINGTSRFLTVEEPEVQDEPPTHITLDPPADRRRAIEKFGFTRVFEERSTQMEIWEETGVRGLIEGVLGLGEDGGTDALVATLGVTGSGKSHTILGSKSQRGITQISLDALFRMLGPAVANPQSEPALEFDIQAADVSEATIVSAQTFIDSVYTEPGTPRQSASRSATPVFGESAGPTRRNWPRPPNLPTKPDLSDIVTPIVDSKATYVVLLSMYEVYNDRIFDLLTAPPKARAGREPRRRPLLFKSTEASPDRKVVAGLKKVMCTSLSDALLVLEAGLHERRVAGTGSNLVSSRSHGFFMVEVLRGHMGRSGQRWEGNTLTVVDLAGSERAREAKTAGVALAEAGKINESLMYLGQCLQMQTSNKPNIAPFRQCKLTELLFSNSFPSATPSFTLLSTAPRAPQKGVMLVTADPLGDFNATSQILRYSALAREVAVPRIPSLFSSGSVSSTASTRSISPNSKSMLPPPVPANRRVVVTKASGGWKGGSGSPMASPRSPHLVGGQHVAYQGTGQHMGERGTMELAALEIARLAEEVENLRTELAAEISAREAAEMMVEAMEEKMVDQEAIVREEVMAEFDERFELEAARWKANLAAEVEWGEEYVDRKISVLEKGLDLENLQDQEDKENQLLESLEEENARLRRENEVLRSELAARSPTKRVPLQEREDFAAAQAMGVGTLGKRLERLRVGVEGGQKLRESGGSYGRGSGVFSGFGSIGRGGVSPVRVEGFEQSLSPKR